MEDKKVFSAKQVFILVLGIVVAIAFFESDSWKDFGLNVLVYGVVTEFVTIVLAGLFEK